MSSKKSNNISRQRNQNNWYLDLETYCTGNREEPDLDSNNVFAYAAGILIGSTYKDFFGLNCLDRLLDYIAEKGKGIYCTIWIHNAFYDFHFLLEAIRIKWPKTRVKARFTDDDRLWLFAEIKNRELKLDIKFGDTWRWDQSYGLKTWSEILDTPFEKLELETYDKWNMYAKGQYLYYNENQRLNFKEEKKYLENDVKLLPYVHSAITEMKDYTMQLPIMPEKKLHKRDDYQGKLTKSGLSKMVLEQYLNEALEQGFKIPVSPEELRMMEISYIGGFTSGNKDITHIDLDEPIIKSYDVNSEYPSIMAQGLPYGEYLLSPPKGEYCTWYVYEMTYCDWKPKYSFFKAHFFTEAHNKLVRKNAENGLKVQYYILKEYYDLCKEMCDTDIKVVGKHYQRIDHRLDKLFNYLYDLRLERKKAGDIIGEQSIKLTMNAAYGKLGEKPHEQYYNYNDKQGTFDLVAVEDSKIHFTSILTGNYVTTQGRLKVLRAIIKEVEQGNTFLYCDTDSIKIIEYKKALLEVDPYKLGYWKPEGEYTGYAYPLKNKRWYLYNKYKPHPTDPNDIYFSCACSGFSKGKELIKGLTHEQRLIFFNPNFNTLVIKGKRMRKLVNSENNWKTILFSSDICTQTDKKQIDYWIWEEQGKYHLSDKDPRQNEQKT